MQGPSTEPPPITFASHTKKLKHPYYVCFEYQEAVPHLFTQSSFHQPMKMIIDLSKAEARAGHPMAC